MTHDSESQPLINFLPSSMHKECNKAAATLRSFCANDSPNHTTTTPKIPPHILTSALALVIFSTARIGMHLSGATGSGIIITRLPSTGTWGPPAAITVHGLSAGVGAGVAMYDCICVVNTPEGLEQFTQKRGVVVGGQAVAAGPWGGVGGGERRDDDGDVEGREGEVVVKKGKPAVYTYTKTKGLYVGIQVDGTVFSQRDSANAAFYGGKVTVEQILKGDVKEQQGEKLWPAGAKGLLSALEVAERQ